MLVAGGNRRALRCRNDVEEDLTILPADLPMNPIKGMIAPYRHNPHCVPIFSVVPFIWRKVVMRFRYQFVYRNSAGKAAPYVFSVDRVDNFFARIARDAPLCSVLDKNLSHFLALMQG